MIKVEAIVREERMEDVKDALRAIDVRGITVSQVMGCGTQLGYTHRVRGSKVAMNMLTVKPMPQSMQILAKDFQLACCGI